MEIVTGAGIAVKVNDIPILSRLGERLAAN
jgi:hypothetical protein